MLKKAVRIGILAVMVISFAFSPLIAKPAQAQPIKPTTWNVTFEIFDVPWDGTTSYTDLFDKYEAVDDWGEPLSPEMTIGELRAMVEAEVGYAVQVVAVMTHTYCWPEDAYLVPTSDTDIIGDYETCGAGYQWAYFLIFKAPDKVEVTRLTLYGYIQGDGETSCTLWSLDGSKNLRADEKCGAKVDMVCTIRLVEKELKYNCEDGYGWLGEQITHDPKWLSWADKFASKNGMK